MRKSTIAKYRNFGKLYQLPERIKRKLQTEAFAKFSDEKKYLNPISKYLALEWIKKIPKAELHYHIGGSMNADMVFNLALSSLWHKNEEWNQKDANREKKGDSCMKFFKISMTILTPLLSELEKNKGREQEVFSNWKKDFEALVSDAPKKEVNNDNLIEENDNCNDVDKKKKEFLDSEILSIGEQEKWKEELSQISDEDIVFEFMSWEIKRALNKEKIKSDEIEKEDVIKVFIVLVGIAEGRTEKSIEKFWEMISEVSCIADGIISPDINYTKSSGKRFKSFFKKLLDSNKSDSLKKIKLNRTLHNLISSRNRKGSLKDYLRGSIFCGDLHLQYYENIFACIAHLVNEAAEDNIKYLEIRVSPEGYIKKNLTTQEAIQALFDGADCVSQYLYSKEKFIWVNFIVTAKRHKTPDKMAIEISSAITNRERNIRKKENLKKIQDKLPGNRLIALGYDWQPSRIVGFDLAGIEKGYKPAQYEEDFAPLFKTCSFLTIHAGEEGSAQNIWEAVYKLNARRIGHGLTLIEHRFLLDLAKNTQICIEMAPISNIYTNPRLEERYPLYDYIKKGLCVTINTDDKAWSDSTLSDEYVKSAELYWKMAKKKNLEDEYLTKWEVLRIVKNGFKKAFIEREEVRDLLKSVEEEIYQFILESEKIEKETFPL